MSDPFIEAVNSWGNYYFMTGGAAASLIGLMLVALSLGFNLVNDETRDNIKTFVQPSINYFVTMLLLACVMLIPNLSRTAFIVLFGVGGLVGLAQALHHTRRLVRAALHHGDFNLIDWLAQVIGPNLSYLVLFGAALALAAEQSELALSAIWLADVGLLLCAISNTWSLVLWIIDQRRA